MEIDYEKEYNEALERAKHLRDSKYQTMNAKRVAEEIFPVLAESEDERIRKLLIWQVYRNIEDETNDLAGSVYDGIKGHDPDLEESIEDWKRCLAYLEKQKPENVSATTMIPSCWEVDQKEQKPPITGNDFGWIDELKHDLEHPEELDQKVDDVLKQRNGTRALEWSEEDESQLDDIEKAISNYYDLNHAPQYHYWLEQKLKSFRPQPKAELTLLDKNIIEAAVAFVEQNDHFDCWRGIDKHTVIKALRSLKPHWKPSEEQMNALNALNCHGDLSYVGQQKQLISLYNDLKKLI